MIKDLYKEKQPDKWRETINPFSIKFNNFNLKEVLGYPHAGNDGFYVNGITREGQKYIMLKLKRNL